MISYASRASRRTDHRISDASSVDSEAIKNFFKEMMRKLCPERPRYFNRPLEDRHSDNGEVCLSVCHIERYLFICYSVMKLTLLKSMKLVCKYYESFSLSQTSELMNKI